MLGSVSGAQQIVIHKKPDPSVVPLAVQLKKSVVNIEMTCVEGNHSISGGGTGFFVSYGDDRLPKGLSFQYLVTNRHVAECWDQQNHIRPVQSLSIRVNTKDGLSKVETLDSHAWQYSTDESVDLAAMPIVLGGDWSAYLLPVDAFVYKNNFPTSGIAEGSPIILSGYFYQVPGELRFQSIVREGILSMIPDEPLETTTGKRGPVYLCDVHIFGGNSGSPVLVSSDWTGIEGYHLLGVISGYYYEDEDFNLEIASTIKGKGKANSGIAMVVPADLLKDLLDKPVLKQLRESYLATQAATPPKQ
jgi:S1-C subfamily serine protease